MRVLTIFLACFAFVIADPKEEVAEKAIKEFNQAIDDLAAVNKHDREESARFIRILDDLYNQGMTRSEEILKEFHARHTDPAAKDLLKQADNALVNAYLLARAAVIDREYLEKRFGGSSSPSILKTLVGIFCNKPLLPPNSTLQKMKNIIYQIGAVEVDNLILLGVGKGKLTKLFELVEGVKNVAKEAEVFERDGVSERYLLFKGNYEIALHNINRDMGYFVELKAL